MTHTTECNYDHSILVPTAACINLEIWGNDNLRLFARPLRWPIHDRKRHYPVYFERVSSEAVGLLSFNNTLVRSFKSDREVSMRFRRPGLRNVRLRFAAASSSELE